MLNTPPGFWQPSYDVIVTGGGIHGAGIAQACAAAGYSCLLLEKRDWATGTSSRSSKLLHGGLRYLQTGQFALVRECIQERERLLHHAPDIARINWFYLPVYRDSHYSRWQLWCGLMLYRLFTGLRDPHGQFRRVPPQEWDSLHGLCTQDLLAVFAYQDGQTDDRLLTKAVKNSACTLGAHAAAPAELLQAQRQDGQWQVRVKTGEQEHTVQCSVLVNAAGPWVNEIIARCGRTRQLPVELVQGTHLVLRHPISEECFYLEAADHRAVFVLPWYGKTLVGTTETPFQGPPEATHPTPQEVDYLLDTVRRRFPQADLTIDEQWSGLRVLPASSQSAFVRSRDTQFLDDDGLVSVYGGKLTAYRATATKVMPIVRHYLGPRTPVAEDTYGLPLAHP